MRAMIGNMSSQTRDRVLVILDQKNLKLRCRSHHSPTEIWWCTNLACKSYYLSKTKRLWNQLQIMESGYHYRTYFTIVIHCFTLHTKIISSHRTRVLSNSIPWLKHMNGINISEIEIETYTIPYLVLLTCISWRYENMLSNASGKYVFRY